MQPSYPVHPLTDGITPLRVIMCGLSSGEDTERDGAHAADVARIAAVLIRAVGAEHTLERSEERYHETALATIVARTLDALDALGNNASSLVTDCDIP